MSLNNRRVLKELAKSITRDLRQRETDAEKLFWKYVRNRGLENKKFYRQYPFYYDLTGKESFFIADFYCYEESLIVELDGEYHKYRLREDAQRAEILRLLGIRVLRFSNEDVINRIDMVLGKLRSEFRNRGS